MIELHQVSGGYGGKPLLEDISLTIPAGCVTAVIGPNGCGKSTLLRMIAGLHPLSGGSVAISGVDNRERSRKEMAKQLSLLPQSRGTPSILVENLVLHGRFPYMGYPRRYREEDRAAAQEAMKEVGVAQLAKRNVTTLSGGERQKVYLAMLLAQGTPVVLMDEPTGSLDIAHKFEVMALARKLARQGKTVVLVLHELELALEYADWVVLMEQGRVRDFGTPEEILESGQLEKVFSIRAERVETEGKGGYVFRPTEGEHGK